MKIDPASARLVAMVSLLLSTTGCGSLYLHNELREKQATEAKTAWAQVDTAAVIASERANLAQLLNAELDTQDKLAMAIRDQQLRSLVDSDSITQTLYDDLDRQMGRLGATDSAATTRAIQDAQYQKQTWTKRLASANETWSQVSLLKPAPQCADLMADGAAQPTPRSVAITAEVTVLPTDTPETKGRKALAKETLKQIQALCSAQPTSIPYSKVGGAISTAYQRLEQDKAQAASAQATLAIQASNYEAASKAYTEALASKAPNAQEKVKAAFADLETAIQLLESSPDALSRQFISKKRLESLDSFVDAVTQANKDGKLPEGANKATVAFVMFPKLADDAQKSLNDAKAPLALPLLIRRNQEQLQLEAVNREVAARKAMLRIGEASLQATVEQLHQLDQARKALDQVADNAHVKGATTANAFKNTTPQEREYLYRAVVLYLDALNRLEGRRMKLEYQYIAAHHELQLAYAEVNAKQWSSLIGSTVEQVSAASAGGIKSDNVVALLGLLGIFYIGNGVN